MTTQEFIENIAGYVKKYAATYNVCVFSPIIAQAILESDKGTSELAVNAHNYFGLKYRKGRCKTCVGIYHKVADAAEKYGQKGNFVVGANISAFEKVADAMMCQGIV